MKSTLTLITSRLVSPAWTVIGGSIGSCGALSLTSFNVTTKDSGDDAAVPLFSRATTWNVKRPGLGGSRSKFSSLTTSVPVWSIEKNFVVNSKL